MDPCQRLLARQQRCIRPKGHRGNCSPGSIDREYMTALWTKIGGMTREQVQQAWLFHKVTARAYLQALKEFDQ